MELHALHVQGFVAYAHHFAIVGPGGGFQAIGAGAALDGQRVVAVDRELLGQSGKHALLRGGDDAGFAVHQLLRPHDVAAKRRADTLVAQAHAQHGHPTGKVPDGRHRNARLGRRTRAGGNHQPVHLPAGQQRIHLLQRDFVIAGHGDRGTQFAEILDDVVGEAVVVVDHQQFHDGSPQVSQVVVPGTAARKRANSPRSYSMKAAIMAR